MISYIGLGSNLNSNFGNSVDTLHSAFSALDDNPNITLIAHSSLYGSKPHGPQDQPDYVNAVAKIETSLAPLDLLDSLQHIENIHSRIRTEQRWGSRTLDLDLLLYADHVIESERLIVPHPRMTERPFVLYPLDEISNGLIFPNGKPLADYLTTVDNDLWVLQAHSHHNQENTSHDKA